MPDLKEELIVTYLIQKVSSAMLCFLIVFSHEFVKAIGKANVKELAMEETWWKKNRCSKHDFLFGCILPEFWAPSGMASGLPFS